MPRSSAAGRLDLARLPTLGSAGRARLEARLSSLAPDQRAAATAPVGPILCVAPAGSGKPTTLVARAAWLVAGGADPATMCAVTFNRRAAEELGARLGDALAELAAERGCVRVRTFHALGREILLDAGEPVEPLVDRAAVLERMIGRPLAAAEQRRLDDSFSRLKLDLPLDSETERGSNPRGPPAGRAPAAMLEAFARYQAELAARGALDFDDLLSRSVAALQRDSILLSRWRARSRALLVDEVQDLDRTQLRLALLLAAPENCIFLVGDDDQP